MLLCSKLQIYDAGVDSATVIGITAHAGLLPITPHDAAAGVDAPRRVPLERWDMEDVQRTSPVPLEARFGAFVQDADLFDGTAFSISRCSLGIYFAKLLLCITQTCSL